MLLKLFKLLDNKAQRSPGLQGIFGIFQKSAGKTRRAMSEYERLTSFTHTPNWFGVGKGPTDQELRIASEMLAYGHLYKKLNVTPAQINQAGKDQGDLLSGKGSGDEKSIQLFVNNYKHKLLYHLKNLEMVFRMYYLMKTAEQKFSENDDGTPLDDRHLIMLIGYIEKILEAAIAQSAIDVLVANIEAVQGQRQASYE